MTVLIADHAAAWITYVTMGLVFALVVAGPTAWHYIKRWRKGRSLGRP